MDKKISVIIPLYNKGLEIERTLNSVFQQTKQNFEIIVVDDHSSDDGPTVVERIRDPRITLIKQEHRGVSYTRNHGVDLATNDFIAFLDADDEWTPNHLETILKLIEKYPEAGMYTTAFKIQTKEGKNFYADYKYIPNPPWEGILPDYFKSSSFGDHPVNSTVVTIPKKIFYEMGGFPQEYWYGEDTDLFGKIALKYPVAFSWELGGIYHCDAMNRACKKILPIDSEEPFVITAREALKRGEVKPEYKESLNDYISVIEISRAIRNIRSGNIKMAQTILKHCSTKKFYFKKMRWLCLAKLPFPILHFLLRIIRKLN